MCPALTFIARGSRLGLVSGLANLSVSILPLFFGGLGIQCGRGLGPSPACQQSVSLKQHRLPVSMGLVWVPSARSDIRFADSQLRQGPVLEFALLNPAKGIAGGFKHVSTENSGRLP